MNQKFKNQLLKKCNVLTKKTKLCVESLRDEKKSKLLMMFRNNCIFIIIKFEFEEIKF